ncbi:ribonuclease III domain-containing protein [Lactarius indigo]|nr:ribonuclease III domain-containing protein [Lactarius indigo]
MSLSNEELTRPSSSPTHLTVTKMLPLLPRIWSTQRLKQIFTHSSMSARPRSGFEFEAPHADPMYDNEGLAHIGDGVLSLAVTDLIQGRYPRLHVGPTSKMRDRIKCGGTLARITVQYGLHERLRGENPRLKNEQRVQVNVFKAYVGGLFKEQGIDVVKKWLNQLFEPLVDAAYWAERQHYLEHAVPATPSPTPSPPPPPQRIAPVPSLPGRAAEGLKQAEVKGQGRSEATKARNRPTQRQSLAAAGTSLGAIDRPGGQHTQRGIGSRDGRRRDAEPDSSYTGRHSGALPRRRSPSTAEMTERGARKRLRSR